MRNSRVAIPRAAERLNLRDRTRIARALEVIEATGRSLLDWHHEGQPPLLPKDSFRAVFLAPERDELYARIDARFDAMLGAGALTEVERLAARGLDPLLPAMKAHGVPALIRHLRGELSLEEAATIGRADTRHYAKRQFTWFRHQLPEFEWIKPEEARGWLAAVCEYDAGRQLTRFCAQVPDFTSRRTPGTPLHCQNRAGTAALP